MDISWQQFLLSQFKRIAVFMNSSTDNQQLKFPMKQSDIINIIHIYVYTHIYIIYTYMYIHIYIIYTIYILET